MRGHAVVARHPPRGLDLQLMALAVAHGHRVGHEALVTSDGEHGGRVEPAAQEHDGVPRHRDPTLLASAQRSAAARAARNCRVAPAGDAAARMAEMAATPAAPALRTSVTRAGVIPPIAMTGISTRRVTRASASSPWGAPYRRLEGVSYTGPKKSHAAPAPSARCASSSECTEAPMRRRLSLTT